MGTLFNEVLYRPLFNLLIGLYNILPGGDFGVAIIVLTFLIKIVFFPLTLKTFKSQKALSDLNPQMNALKEKFKDDKAAQSAAIMALYKEKKINPVAGCLPLLIQLPILVALYRVFLSGVDTTKLGMLYSFVSHPSVINKMFIGLIDITQKSHYLAFFAGAFQMLQAKLSKQNTPQNSTSKELSALNSQMLYFFPVMIIIIGWSLPAGIMLYWVASTVFSIAEQLYIKKLLNN